MINKTLRISLQKIKNILWHFPKSVYYNYHYGYPSRKLSLIAVTGTDGKTTTANLVHLALQQAGIKAGVISTLGAKIGDREITVGLHTTSPDPSVVQKIFRDMVNEGLTHAVIEVTAHAIDQFRYWGCQFQVAAITNTSHEHLDDFFDLKSYIQTKARLFRQANVSILNKDDPSYELIAGSYTANYKSISINQKSDYQAKDIALKSKSLSFSVKGTKFKTDSAFYYQIYNILTTHAILTELKIDPKILINLIRIFPDMKGRREVVKNDLGLRCLIDFAHTPAALFTTLNSLKTTSKKGKLIVIFGATGGRDPSKRPLMGQVVSRLADIGIITADDTRNERIEDINRHIISGIDQDRLKNKKFAYYDIPKRQDAFNLAVKLATTGDTIIACGKGHETSILHGNTEYPWSESEAFRTAFRFKTA